MFLDHCPFPVERRINSVLYPSVLTSDSTIFGKDFGDPLSEDRWFTGQGPVLARTPGMKYPPMTNFCGK